MAVTTLVHNLPTFIAVGAAGAAGYALNYNAPRLAMNVFKATLTMLGLYGMRTGVHHMRQRGAVNFLKGSALALGAAAYTGINGHKLYKNLYKTDQTLFEQCVNEKLDTDYVKKAFYEDGFCAPRFMKFFMNTNITLAKMQPDEEKEIMVICSQYFSNHTVCLSNYLFKLNAHLTKLVEAKQQCQAQSQRFSIL